jgi:ribonuclease III
MFGRRPPSSLESRLGYRFKRSDLLTLSLTHRSFANEQGKDENYERLEFLGDAVLGLVTAQWLFERHPELPEGELSKRKAQLVSRTTLARFAESLDLGASLHVGVGEERSGGRTKPSLLADSMEAVFGAIYLDGGLEAAARVIETMLDSHQPEVFHRFQTFAMDAKTQLQEMVQAWGGELPAYRLAGATGPDHDKVFVVECWLGEELAGRGEGTSKKVAEQRAASQALEHLAARGEGQVVP